jgi:hypothetical protein
LGAPPATPTTLLLIGVPANSATELIGTGMVLVRVLVEIVLALTLVLIASSWPARAQWQYSQTLSFQNAGGLTSFSTSLIYQSGYADATAIQTILLLVIFI